MSAILNGSSRCNASWGPRSYLQSAGRRIPTDSGGLWLRFRRNPSQTNPELPELLTQKLPWLQSLPETGKRKMPELVFRHLRGLHDKVTQVPELRIRELVFSPGRADT